MPGFKLQNMIKVEIVILLFTSINIILLYVLQKIGVALVCQL